MPARPGSPYNTARYRKAKARFIATSAPFCTYPKCPVPGRYIDRTLSGNHPWGPTIDHTHPTSKGGPMWHGWQLMHRRCNMVKGAKAATRIRTPYTW